MSEVGFHSIQQSRSTQAKTPTSYMNTTQSLKFLFIIFFTTTLLSSVDSEEPIDYYAPENVRKFADFLYEQGDYLRAVGEYQRYLFYQPGKSEETRYRIALCYRFAGQTEQAIQNFQVLLRAYPEGRFTSQAYYQIGATYFLHDQFEQSVGFLHEVLPHITNARQHAEAEQLIGLSYLMQKQWSEAGQVFKTLQGSEVDSVSQKAVVYHSYAEKGADLPTRSPFLSGVLSTIVPGAGRLYTGRVSDAFTSLFIVGLTGWQAYEGFQRDGLSSVKGWTLGTLSGIFYVGNIYGSVISARVYNRRVADEFLTTLSIELP